jgi:glycerate dehydrogenase
MKLAVLDAFTSNPGDLSWDALTNLAECTFYDRTASEEVLERATDCEIFLTNKTVINGATIKALPKLRYIGVLATGYNVVDTVAAKEQGVCVCNVPGYSTPSVAQTVWALLLELTHRVGHHAATVQHGRWTASPDFSYWDGPLVELSGRTLGILGYGAIGEAVARIALAMDMKVVANRRSWKTDPLQGVEKVDFDTCLTTSDVLTLHFPLTETTLEIINRETLAKMKAGAYLINTARGPLINEADLAAALNSGHLAGAGLDVLSTEPPKGNNPLLTAKNCFITPHIAWASQAARARLIETASRNVEQFLKGSPQNVVA